MSRDDRDSMMDSLRAAAGIVGVASTTTSTDQGADCVIDTYQPDRDGVSWQVQGCSYDKFPGLLSLGISRTGPTDDPPHTDRSDDRHGRRRRSTASVTFVEVRFGRTRPGRLDAASVGASQTAGSASSPAAAAVGRRTARRLADVPR